MLEEKKIVKEENTQIPKSFAITLFVFIVLLTIIFTVYITDKITQLESRIDNSNSENALQFSSYAESTLKSLKENNEFFYELNELLGQRNELMQSVNDSDLDRLIKILSDPDSLFPALNENPQKAEKAFMLASDEKLLENYREAYYMYAITHNSFEQEFYKSYFQYLDSIQAPSSSYYYIITLLQNFIANCDLERLPVLVQIEELAVNKYLDVCNTETETELSDSINLDSSMNQTWESLFEQFLLLSDNFEQDSLDTLYSSLTTLYSLFSTRDNLIDEQYELITNINSLNRTYMQACNMFANLQGSEDSAFITLYENSFSIWSSLISVFNYRDKNNESSYSELIDTWISNILIKNTALISRYDYILYTYCKSKIVAAKISINRSTKANDKNDYLKALDTNLGLTIGKISDYAYVSELYDSYAELENLVYQAQYTDYQVYVATKLSEINDAFSGIKDKDKLKILFEKGYFNIDRTLLITQLIVVYDSLVSDAIIKMSTTPIEELLKFYKINKLRIGDV